MVGKDCGGSEDQFARQNLKDLAYTYAHTTTYTHTYTHTHTLENII